MYLIWFVGFAACRKLDLMFVVDGSGSLRDTNPASRCWDNWNMTKNLMNNVIRGLAVDPSNVRVGVVVFSSSARTVISLGSATSKADLTRAVLGLYYTGGRTNTSGGLRMAFEQFHSSAARADAAKEVILVTDGQSDVDSSLDRQWADKLRSDFDVRIQAIGVSSRVDEAKLRQVAGSGLFIWSSDYWTLQTQAPLVVQRLACRSFVTPTHTLPTKTPSPRPTCAPYSVIGIPTNTGMCIFSIQCSPFQFQTEH